MFLLPFAPRGNARMRFRAAFEQSEYCNLSFFDLPRGSIPFHLSLRAEQGLAVVNRRGWEHWGREIKRAVHLPRAGVDVEISFDGNAVAVALDGSEIFRFSNRFRRRFPALQSIGYADFYGGLIGPTLDMDIEVADALGPSPALRLDGRLELRGTAEGALTLPQMEMPPQLARADGELRALIPGRVWQSVPEGAPLTVRVGNTTLEISREALARRIDAMLVQGPEWHGDMRAAGQMIEHARFAELLPLLSAEGQARLAGLVQYIDLEPFFCADGATWPEAEPYEIVPDPAHSKSAQRLAELSAYLSKAALALRDDPSQNVGAWITQHKPARWARGDVVMALTELAANRPDPNEMISLIEAARTQRLKGIPKARSIWEVSSLLPWVWQAGKSSLLPGMITEMAEASEWVMTPPLAWVMARLSEDPAAPHAPKIAQAFCAFLTAQSGYWGRAHCAALTRAMAAAVSASGWHSDTKALLEETALKVYGLSPAFWAAVPDTHLSEVRAAFHTLRATPTHAKAAAVFEDAGCLDLPQFLRDHSAEADGGEAAVRYLAHPATPASAAEATALTAEARDVLPSLYAETPISTDAPERQSAAAAAQMVLAGSAKVPELIATLADLGALADGLRLTVMAGLLLQNREAEAQQLWDAGALPANLPSHPAFDHAGAQLARIQDHPLASVALRRFASPIGTSTPHPLGDVAEVLHDTLICVFSCAAHLETRIPQMRDGWLSDLAAKGIPYVIIIGGGEDENGYLEGDVLQLAVPDDYEGLPQKTLGTLKWVNNHTQFSHMYKVDDDCFVNVDALFGGLDALRHDYWGRPLIRVPGQMDRGWHTQKSTTARGRLELDKSPEPSFYADGGSGYLLSRRAMGAALRALSTAQGQLLLQSSFMEDKLLGDLLALEGITVSGEDYLIAVRRRETPGGVPVPRWVNGFDASQTSVSKLVHLDDPEAQSTAQKRLATSMLRPAKLWPSFQAPALGPHSNALEHISGPISAALRAPVSVVACMRNEMFMLPHFLSHYRALGVENFIIADNCSDDGTLEFLAEEPDVTLFSVDTDYGRSQYGVAWQQAIMAGLRLGQWSLMADADELLVWEDPQTERLPDLLQSAAFETADAARLFMLDMYPKGSLETADFSSGDPFGEAGFTDADPFRRDTLGAGPFSDSRTWTSALRHRLIPGSRPELFVAQKVALLRYAPHMRLTAGLHYVANTRLAARELIFAHFKYNADFRRKAQAEVARGQHFNDAEEYRKYLALVSEGRDIIYEEGLSVPWNASDFARRIFAQGA